MNIMQQNGKLFLKKTCFSKNISSLTALRWRPTKRKKAFFSRKRFYGKVPSFNYRERKEWEMVFSTLGLHPVLSLPRLHGLIGRERKCRRKKEIYLTFHWHASPVCWHHGGSTKREGKKVFFLSLSFLREKSCTCSSFLFRGHRSSLSSSSTYFYTLSFKIS